ncbi:YHS domain-containing (seleno)protein [Blastochloris viridis]|uniref:YHS domain protein n=1 Tax=Blastochloris viridis TaxID=1079 RepID=A0A0H5BDQ9_BLAVI|nr:YHS domain-containing (seleno)protein [Blastochloris viridis]ALK08268.1 hypothetical protein BVIR_470 [Blastochloris viridis]BAR98466.1 YHS domain protein [Blastochloris viridis]CUU44190.1 hypothetical protein BVIRIDIS_32370 [Blastochloris viridis]
MACARQSRQLAFGTAGPVWPALLMVLAVLGSALAATNERVVADRHSGLALWGYDPVAYHLDRQARPGSAEFELDHGGLMWRFVNAGNLAAFKDRPDDYMPAFGGFDPPAVARKAAVPGNPEVFAIWNGKLLMFHNAASRERFFTDPGAIFHAAELGWEDAAKTLPR